jgi:GNAT superfamily N-acetyltransferase
MIRHATRDDYDHMFDMGMEFCEAFGRPADRQSIYTTFDQVSEHGVLLYDERGAMAAAIVSPSPWNFDWLVATELFWWVDEDLRKQGIGQELLDTLELWAREHKADELSMLTMDALGPGPSRIYETHGFQRFETHYAKVL